MLGMSANSVSYNDQGSVESGVDAAQENSNIPGSISSGGAAFSLFSADYKKYYIKLVVALPLEKAKMANLDHACLDNQSHFSLDVIEFRSEFLLQSVTVFGYHRNE
ncbi:hypothetical protein DPX16_3858 [Anabarilius grahami]|uniref:Uncharacterized protein n=1 Tax=Anabarilius grahami TaxID=495550 RepID=A0A3N0XSR0_ANAGA|nr:hypothetical protein DPX16_3858 [Anabarilius grahami]